MYKTFNRIFFIKFRYSEDNFMKIWNEIMIYNSINNEYTFIPKKYAIFLVKVILYVKNEQILVKCLTLLLNIISSNNHTGTRDMLYKVFVKYNFIKKLLSNVHSHKMMMLSYSILYNICSTESGLCIINKNNVKYIQKLFTNVNNEVFNSKKYMVINILSSLSSKSKYYKIIKKEFIQDNILNILQTYEYKPDKHYHKIWNSSCRFISQYSLNCSIYKLLIDLPTIKSIIKYLQIHLVNNKNINKNTIHALKYIKNMLRIRKFHHIFFLSRGIELIYDIFESLSINSNIMYMILKDISTLLYLNDYRTTSIHIACRNHGLDSVKEIINNGNESINTVDYINDNYLHVALQHCNMILVKYLILSGINPQDTDTTNLLKDIPYCANEIITCVNILSIIYDTEIRKNIEILSKMLNINEDIPNIICQFININDYIDHKYIKNNYSNLLDNTDNDILQTFII